MVSKHEHVLGPSEGFGITHIAASTPKVSNPEDKAWDGRICISKFPSDSDASGKGLPLGTTGQKKETGKGAKKANWSCSPTLFPCSIVECRERSSPRNEPEMNPNHSNPIRTQDSVFQEITFPYKLHL